MMNVPAMAVLVSLVHLAMAGVVWTTLVRQWHRLQLTLWVTGAMAAGFCGTLLSLSAHTPAWAHDDLAHALLAPAFALRIVVLRLDLALPTHARLLAVLAVCEHLAYMTLRHGLQLAGTGGLGDAGDQGTFGLVIWTHVSGALWSFAFGWQGVLVGRKYQSRSGWLLALAEGLFGAVLLLRALAMLMGWTPRAMVSNEWDFLLVVAAGFVGALYGNLGYMGLVLDRSNAAVRQARESQLSETLRREAAEQRSAELGQLLAERNQVLHLLAHEVRQPLHNASGAVQAAVLALAGGPGGPEKGLPLVGGTGLLQPASGVELALQRAQGVLGRVHSVLDNTLAAAQLFARDAAPEKADTDLDLLVNLTLGDLTPHDRARVGVEWHTSTQSIELEPGLVRLALRNLLNNAFEHGGPQVQVRLVVAEQLQPAALVLQVVDNGPALQGAALARLQQPTAQGPSGMPWPAADDNAKTHTATGQDNHPPTADAFRRGLGVAIARRVMALHGGQLQMATVQPHGLQASLVFPLPDD